MLSSPKELTKEELLKLLQAIRDVEQNDKERPLYLTVKVSTMAKQDIEEILGRIKPELKERRIWFKARFDEGTTPVV